MQQDTFADSVTREPLRFPSADGTSTIRGYFWLPAATDAAVPDAVAPKGVVLLVHGMAEHIERYDDFARFLAQAGFLVAGHNQIGHGSSADADSLGCLPVKNGRECLVEDVHTLRQLAISRAGHSDVPVFVFGHSMGSFTTRSYIAHHGAGLAGAVICGTGFVPPATSKAGNATARLIARMRGATYKSKLLHGMADGAYAKAVPNARTPLDWLSYDRGNVDRYLADPECGFMFAAGGYATLTSLTAEVCTAECMAMVPHDLPLFYIAGEADPVGDCGEGVHKAFELALGAGITDATCKIYPNMRHEILNETDHQTVYDDVLAWLEGHLPATDTTVEKD